MAPVLEQLCTDAGQALALAASAVENSNWEQSADKYGDAVKYLDRALRMSLCKRASTLSQLERYVEVLETAERAAQLSSDDAEPHYWVAHAHEMLGAHSAAAKAYRAAANKEKDLAVRMSYNEGAQRCSLAAADAKAAQASRKQEEQAALEAARTEATMRQKARELADTAPLAPAAATSGVAVSEAKIEWYQSATVASLDVMAKGVDKEASSVEISARKLSMRLVRPNKPDFVYETELFEEAVPESSSWSASKYKVEVRLRKKKPGVTWVSLDRDGKVASAGVIASAAAQKRQARAHEKQKEWEKKADEELKDYKEDDSAMGVFRELYKGADEDTRRAMMKSYSESGGQVLSTDWSKVSKERVRYKPVGERDD